MSNNAPGNSPGILSVDGHYTQSAGGTLEIELASNGSVAGTDRDHLAASLDGTLDLQLDGGYTPAISNSFADCHRGRLEWLIRNQQQRGD